jgi:hypothetical protein
MRKGHFWFSRGISKRRRIIDGEKGRKCEERWESPFHNYLALGPKSHLHVASELPLLTPESIPP